MDSHQITNQILDESLSSPDSRGRRGFAFVISVGVHAIILISFAFLLPEVAQPHHDWVLAYLVEFDQSGGAGRGAGAGDARAGSPFASAHAAVSAAMPHKPQHAHRDAARAEAKPPHAAPRTAAIAAALVPGAAASAARREPEVPAVAGTSSAPGEVASASLGGRDGNGGGGGGSGGFGGGDGSGSAFAHVEYGRNPGPVYPVEARRRAQQGTVLLRVQVGIDGSVERVEIAQSSGFDMLDDSAVETVRRRWRFVPARRDGIAVESWCQVPIRFALTEASAD